MQRPSYVDQCLSIGNQLQGGKNAGSTRRAGGCHQQAFAPGQTAFRALHHPLQGKNAGNNVEQEAATREALRSYATLSVGRTVIASLAFGSALCGVLLLKKQ